MSDQINPSFQKARDEALRALISDAGLTPDQVSALKLSQVRLSTGTLVIEPDEFDTSTAVRERPFSVKLDAAVQRVLIAWLVVRPDGPNDHLFPGKGADGLDVEAINQVLAAKKPTKSPHAKDSVDAAGPPRAERKTTGTLPEAIPPSPRKAKPEEAAPPSPPVSLRREGPEADAVSLDEIESLRKRLADTYDAWGPAVTAAAMKSAAEPPQGADVPPSAPAEAESLEDESEPVAAPEPVAEAVEPPPAKAEEALVARPKPKPPEEFGAVPPPVGLGERLKGWWKSDEKVSFKLTNRTLVLGGLALLLVICCVGLAVSGVMMLGSSGTSGLLAGATPTVTPATIETAPVATSTASPSPRPTVTITSSSTQTPEATLTPLPATTDTPAPTSTPIVVVVTATPTPEPPATETPVPTDTPEGGLPPEPTVTQIPGFKYPAPVLLEPEDGATVPGVINYLKWEPVGPLADDEWYAVRLIFLQQGQPVYGGDWVKISEWLVPERFYYQADGPALEYRWFVFVERRNSDGTATQISPESEPFVFRWE